MGVRWTPLPKAEALTEPTGETRHYEFLKQNRLSTVSVMRMNGTLEDYLKQVNQEAAEMLETLVLQYAKAEGVTESLKRSDQLEWIQKKNNIRTQSYVLLSAPSLSSETSRTAMRSSGSSMP